MNITNSLALLWFASAIGAVGAQADRALLNSEVPNNSNGKMKSLVATLLAITPTAQHGSSLRLAARRLQESTVRPVRDSMDTFMMTRDLDQLLSDNAGKLDKLRPVVEGVGDDYDDVWLLRFALDSEDIEEARQVVSAAIEWRIGEGKPIVEAAKTAFAEATKDGTWNNAAAFEHAPHASAISPFIGAEGSQIITMPLDNGDLCYVIRASAIDDKGLMKAISVKQLTDFFLYAKELNSLVCNARALKTRRLTQIIAANDLGGRSGLAGDFQKGLSGSSKKAAALYPLLGGPTLLLNLPPLLSFLVKLLKPLFPKSVQEKLRFENGPLSDLDDLKDLRQTAPRAKFISEINALLDQ